MQHNGDGKAEKFTSLEQISEKHLRLLIESAKDHAIFMLDADRKVISWSSGAQTIFGFTETEMIGKSGDIVFVPEDRENKAPENETETARKDGRAETERWHLRKDGSRFWGSGFIHPLSDEKGETVGFVKIIRDLTEPRQLEVAKYFLASIIETSNDSIITIDFDRNITSWNKAAEHLYGYTAEEAIGKNLTMLTLPEDFVEILNRVDAIKNSRAVAIFDTVRHAKGGTLKQLEIVMSPVLDAAGQVIGISTIARDVSERKRREANLAFLAEINLGFAPLLTMEEVGESVGTQLSGYLRLSRCQFSFVDEDSDRVEVVYDYRRDESLPGILGVHRISDIFTEEGRRQFRDGKLTIVNNAAGSPLIKIPADIVATSGFASLVAVPHLEVGQWKLLLTVGRAEPGEWPSDEVELLWELASNIFIRIERARAEEALRISENRLQRMVNIPKVGVVTFDYAANILHANDAFLQILAYSREEFEALQLTWRDFTPPEHKEVSQQFWTSLQDTGQSGPYEQEYYCKDGSKIWLMLVASDLDDGTFVEFAIDIGDRKMAEEALYQSEARFRTLADAVPQVIWANDGAGYANYFNQRWYEFTGLTYQQSEGPGWQAIVHPDDEIASIEKWRKSLTEGKVFDTEYRLRRYDGSYCWFIGRNVPLRDHSGNISGWFGSATDVESLKKTEEALSQSEARLKITMESATDYAIITTDSDRIVERWSQGAIALFGYTEAEMVGQLADNIFTEEDRKAGVPQEEVVIARETGRAADERWHRRKDGSSFFASGVMRPIQNGVLTGYVKVLRDMTQQQLFTEELHRLVAERTLELQRSNDDLQRFASIASHDLQEPLRKLKLFTSVLQKFKEVLPAEGRELLSKIHFTSERMSQLIREVLQFSKIAYGVKEFVLTDLHQILQNVLSDLDLLLSETGTTVTYDSNLPEIEAMPSQINQLFSNLLTNAVKFRREDNQPVINISVLPVLEAELINYPDLIQGKDYIEIVFSDNGIGFEQQYAEQIFQIFERLHSADEFEGTGVGLALCKKIVDNHSGQIFAISGGGKGAAFHILLPVKQ